MYEYKAEREQIFTEEGQQKFLSTRDLIAGFLKETGAFKMGAIINRIFGDTWVTMACVDRLVELGEIKEITGTAVAGQNRVFVKTS